MFVSFFLILLTFSYGYRNVSSATTTDGNLSLDTTTNYNDYNGGYTTGAPNPIVNNCSDGGGAPLTVVADMYVDPKFYGPYLERLIKRVNYRYLNMTRQYIHIVINSSDIFQSVLDTPSDLTNYMYYYSNYYSHYNYNFDNYYFNGYYYYSDSSAPSNITLNILDKPQLLHGLKRGLEVSPAGAVILVMSSGLVGDYDTGLLNEIYTLLDEKQSQVFIVDNRIQSNSLTDSIFNDIASRSFGFYIPLTFGFDVKLMDDMELLLVKPLNCYQRILEVTVNAQEHVQEFNATGSDYILITTSGTLTVSLTDPNGNNTIINTYFSSIVDTNLMKYPTPGIWKIEVTGKKLISLRIFGFNGLENSRNCSDIECHPNATCEEFLGYNQQCICNERFVGNGSSCYDIDECAGDSCWSLYRYSSCINTIGSYIVSCVSGFTYEDKYGCVDIDECASDSLNDCDPLAVCINTYGNYLCYCPYGYFGEGWRCVANECVQGTPCDNGTDCIAGLTNYACIDPCSSYTNYTNGITSASNGYYAFYYSPIQDDWYRFKGEGAQIPEYCVSSTTCGINIPIWLNGVHPTIDEGIVSRTACINWYGQCCLAYFPLSVKACPGGYYVYKLKGNGFIGLNYCTKSNYSCSDMSCFPDEECMTDSRVSACHCSDGIYYNNGTDPNNPADLMLQECGLDQIKVTFKECLLERMGYNSSSLHLRDSNCEGVIERTDASYVVIATMPVNGDCGTDRLVNQTHWMYTNLVYLSAKPDNANGALDYIVNVSCSYSINMETVLWLTTDAFVSEGNLTIGGSSIYPVRMGFFEDSSYTVLYEGPRVMLTNEKYLYVGISVQNKGNSQVVLVIKNCYATMLSESGDSYSYDIMNDYCPDVNDNSLSILENGVSSQGRFQIQILSKFGNYSKMYLHCQVHLCNTTVDACFPICSGTNQTFTIQGAQMENITLGPLYTTSVKWIIMAATILGYL